MSLLKHARYSLGARWIHPMTGPALKEHYINVADDVIESITTGPAFHEVYDFGEDCQILPGTVNMHSHLELSQLDRPLGVEPDETGRRPMAAWIDRLMSFRRGPNYDARAGLWSALIRPELLSETSAVVDIVPPNSQPDSQAFPVRPVRFSFVEWIDWRGATLPLDSDAFGISPHAPQTVCPALLEEAVRRKVPLAMHLAETPEEIEFLRTGAGPLRDLMRRADPGYDPDRVRLGSRPLDYLRLLAEAPRTLVVHGNYLDEEEQMFLADHRETMAVVYCPRSHAWFGHKNYPLKEMLDRGVRVLLGTDSLASNPDLSLVGEMKAALRLHPEVAPETIFRMGTLDGATWLGESDFGRLDIGGPARFAFVTADDTEPGILKTVY